MPNKDRNIPKRRFKEFENADAWELRKLGEVAKYRNGKAHEQSIVAEGDYVVINSKFVSTGGVVEKFSSRQLEPLYKNEITFVLSDIPNGKALSKTFLVDVDQKYTLNQRIAAITPKESASFLNELLNRNSYFLKFDNGVGQTNLAKDQVLEFNAFFPSLPEQEAIGTFFSTLDQHITLHQRKLDMLKEQKKTYLKLLFPAKGQTKPVLRFQGFEDDWEKVKLGEIGETFTGLSGKTKEDFGHGEGKFITYVNVFNNPISDLLGTDRIEVDESQTNVQFGDIFFTTSSETPEEVGMSSVWLGNGNNIYLNSFCFGFRPTLKLSNHFMAYVLRSTEIRKKFIFLAQGISRYNISKTKVMNISIPLPTLPEQESIGTFFQTLDQEIAQVEDKLASLKEMKKTLLRKLFV